MKVLMTTDTVGGVWTYALELVEGLAAKGVEVTLVAMGTPLSPGQRADLRGSRARRVYARACALEWMDDPWRDVERAGEWLLAIADEVSPDVVHLSGYAHAALPWSAPVVVVGHSDVLSWHQAVHGIPAGPRWSRYRAAVEQGLAAADLLVAPTRAMLAELVRLYDPPCVRVVIPNGSGRRFERREKEPFVLSAGRLWDEAKNVAALARVAPRLGWPVAVAGAGEVAPGLRSLGALDRAAMDDVLGRAAIFAEPARYEPFGLAALEAGRARCALVLGDIPSLREVWGDAAWFVPAGDDDALAHAVEQLIRRPRLRAEQGERAARHSLRYTLSVTADGYAAAYRAAGARAAVAAA